MVTLKKVMKSAKSFHEQNPKSQRKLMKEAKLTRVSSAKKQGPIAYKAQKIRETKYK
jgi:predicted FMN-binding regulatory protein PaiB